MVDEISRRNIEAVAEAAAEKTVGKVFSVLGVDITDQAQLNEFRADLIHARKIRHVWERDGFQADLKHARKMRRLWEKGGVRIFMLVLTAIVVGVLTMFWIGFTDTIKK